MVPKCKMESAVDAGYLVVAGLSLEQALLLPLQTEAGQPKARPDGLLRCG